MRWTDQAEGLSSLALTPTTITQSAPSPSNPSSEHHVISPSFSFPQMLVTPSELEVDLANYFDPASVQPDLQQTRATTPGDPTLELFVSPPHFSLLFVSADADRDRTAPFLSYTSRCMPIARSMPMFFTSLFVVHFRQSHPPGLSNSNNYTFPGWSWPPFGQQRHRPVRFPSPHL